MQTSDDSSDEIDGILIHQSADPEQLSAACREGNLSSVNEILKTWPPDRRLPHEALLEAVAWSRVEIVRRLIGVGVSATAKGSVLTPGGSGVTYEQARHISAIGLANIMAGAGHHPQALRQQPPRHGCADATARPGHRATRSRQRSMGTP